MTDVVLINPQHYEVKWKSLSFPLSLLYLGTWLKHNGFSVKIIDTLTQDNERTKQEINEFVPDAVLVGFTVMTPQVPNALEMSKHIKEKYPNTKIVWGGVHVMLFPHQVLKSEFVDFIIIGEGEEPLMELVRSLKQDGKISDIKNLGYKFDRQIKINPERDAFDMNRLPFLEYSLLGDDIWSKQTLLINGSRGCPYRCTFCINIALKNRKYRYRDAKRIVDEIEYVKEKYKIDYVNFIEDNFFVNRKKAEAIITELINRKVGVEWTTNCRVDYFKDGYIDKVFLKRAKESGCYMLKFGAESGSQRVLDFLKKDITIEQILKSAKECHEAGIRPNYSFMTAIPTETADERMATLDLIDKLFKIAPEVAIISPQPYRPYPGGELADMVQDKYDFEFPNELEGWAGIVSKSIDSSMSDLEHFPWVENPDSIRLQRICSYIVTGNKKGKRFEDRLKRVSPFLAIGVIGLYVLAKLRWKLRFFCIPLEYNAIMRFYKTSYT